MVENQETLKVTVLSDTQLMLSRTFDAPRDLVFEACTRPEHVKHWWGPRGTEVIVEEMDFRVGGTWRFVQRMPDGSEFPFKGEYREIVRPERVVQTFIFDVEPYSAYESVETATYTEQDGKTTISVVAQYQSIEHRDGVIASGMESGARETYERLAEYIQELKVAAVAGV
jgi:uncharacterized protein YndB with AHSA1/START domain